MCRSSNTVLNVIQLSMKGTDFVFKPTDHLTRSGNNGRRLKIHPYHAFQLLERQLDVRGFKVLVHEANAARLENEATNSRVSSVIVALHGFSTRFQLAQ